MGRQKICQSSHFITNKDIDVIFYARKSLLYYNNKPWVKKGESNFDVTMGTYDGAEVCELIGIFMLLLLSKHINKNHIGLHRDDGLAISKNTSGPEAEKLEKKFHKLFKEKDLDIIVQCNLKITTLGVLICVGIYFRESTKKEFRGY